MSFIFPHSNHFGGQVFINTVSTALAPKPTGFHASKPAKRSMLAAGKLFLWVGNGSTYGAAGSLMAPVLTPTMPTSSALATRQIRRVSRLKM